ncbi:MAG: hypothetical protein K8R58_14050 [Bacteroidales bacterium]|nr:hypothetical protein [Bacteroidales bacterium]
MIFSNIKFKAIVMLIALFLMCFVFMIQTERELEAFALSSTVIIGILVALSACGLYALNYDSANSIALDFWNKASDTIKAAIYNNVDESTREITITEPVFDFLRQYITDFYTVGEMYHSVDALRVMAPWGVSYLYTPIDWTMTYYSMGISAELYGDAIKYSQIDFGGKTLEFKYSSYMYSYIYFDDVVYNESGEEHDAVRYLNVGYDDLALGETICYSYAERAITRISTYGEPYFTFLYNALTDVMYPVIIYREDAGAYKIKAFRIRENGSHLLGDTAYRIDEDIEAVVDGTIVLDPEYDILDRTMPLPYEIGQIIGLAAGEVIAEEWADVMTIDR